MRMVERAWGDFVRWSLTDKSGNLFPHDNEGRRNSQTLTTKLSVVRQQAIGSRGAEMLGVQSTESVHLPQSR